MKTLHQRFGHINLKALKTLASKYSLNIKPYSFNIEQCNECHEAKMLSQRHKVSLSNYKDIDYLEMVHSDITGPILPKT